MSPVAAKEMYGDRPWYQPAMWYSRLWPTMKAFALPSFSEGYIRINLMGRETSGVVKPEDYDSVVNDICEQLRNLKCARTGTPMVAELVKTRQTPSDNDPKLPDADIVVSWQESYATDMVSHPLLGIIGPMPHFRAGSHRHTGFLLASGPCISAGSTIEGGHALDIAPTILNLLDARIPQHIRGKNCVPT
jgi:predicted AlkP superfamily phosphohydrolase/phosphomutase